MRLTAHPVLRTRRDQVEESSRDAGGSSAAASVPRQGIATMFGAAARGLSKIKPSSTLGCVKEMRPMLRRCNMGDLARPVVWPTAATESTAAGNLRFASVRWPRGRRWRLALTKHYSDTTEILPPLRLSEDGRKVRESTRCDRSTESFLGSEPRSLSPGRIRRPTG
jgi:hypothetical protein